jgi:prolipoprotein diacylglyceryltransferase
MYPDFYHLLRELIGIEIPQLSLLKTFGFLVAMGFLAGGYVIYSELKRKEDDGLVGYTIQDITIGKPTGMFEYITSGIVGFIIGFKLLGMFLEWKIASPDPMSYLFSPNGNIILGFVIAGLSVFLKYNTSKKEGKNGIQTKKVKTFPHHRVGDIAVIAAIGGFAGAKIFNAFETWEDFLQDPMGNLLSSSGLTFYGGLIVATLALWYYARKINLDFRHLCDAAAPALILAYGIGRLGCQISGDGDWGIYNSAYTTDVQGKVVTAVQPFDKTLVQYKDHINRHFEPGAPVPHKSITAFAGLPVWLFAYNYPNNVNNVGVELPNCQGDYCSVLPMPVFPTPIYEFAMALIIFGILWRIRKRFSTPLSMFSIYLVFNGIERFLIEQIRVNYKYDWGFIQPTQAEIIAVAIVIFGVLLFAFRQKIDQWLPKTPVLRG